VFPLTLFNCQDDTTIPSRPEGLTLWQDEAHLKELTVDEQRIIYKFQYAGNLPTTKFKWQESLSREDLIAFANA